MTVPIFCACCGSADPDGGPLWNRCWSCGSLTATTAPVCLEAARTLSGAFLTARATPGSPRTLLAVDAVLDDSEGWSVTAAPDPFHALAIPERYGAVVCGRPFGRGWRQLIADLARAALPGGLVLVAAPHPGPTPDPHSAAVPSADRMVKELEVNGLRVLDRRLWPAGQAYLCRKPADAL